MLSVYHPKNRKTGFKPVFQSIKHKKYEELDIPNRFFQKITTYRIPKIELAIGLIY